MSKQSKTPSAREQRLAEARIAIDQARLLVLHVPLGVALVALALWLAIWPWTRGARGVRR